MRLVSQSGVTLPLSSVEGLQTGTPLSIQQPHLLGPKDANEIFLSPHPSLVFYLQTLHSFQPLFYLQWIEF